MLKIVVLCAFFAAAAAEPSGYKIFGTPITTYSSVLSPAVTSISQQASSVIHPSPLVYSTPVVYPYAHFIKKRSAPVFSYPIVAPYAATYAAAAPLLASTYTTPYLSPAPLISHAPLATPAVHLIKKRSAPFTYISPETYAAAISPQTYAAASALPLLKPTYTAASTTNYVQTPFITSSSPLLSQPIPAFTHFIKKRSAPSLLTYSAPLSYSHQSRIDVQSHTPYSSVSYIAPVAYSSPIIVPTVLKK